MDFHDYSKKLDDLAGPRFHVLKRIIRSRLGVPEHQAEDIAQKGLLNARKQLLRGNVPDNCDYEKYIIQAAILQGKNHRKAERRLKARVVFLPEEGLIDLILVPSRQEQVIAQEEREERLRLLDEAILELPNRDRQVVNLRRLGASPEEVAISLGITRNAESAAYSRAKTTIKAWVRRAA